MDGQPIEQAGQTADPARALEALRSGSRGMRVGRKLGRTLYVRTGGGPDSDVCIGIVDSPELAALIVEAVNARRELVELWDLLGALDLTVAGTLSEGGDARIPVEDGRIRSSMAAEPLAELLDRLSDWRRRWA